MVGDALTKSMQYPQLIELMYKGTLAVHNEEKHKIRVRIITADAIRQDYTEKRPCIGDGHASVARQVWLSSVSP